MGHRPKRLARPHRGTRAGANDQKKPRCRGLTARGCDDTETTLCLSSRILAVTGRLRNPPIADPAPTHEEFKRIGFAIHLWVTSPARDGKWNQRAAAGLRRARNGRLRGFGQQADATCLCGTWWQTPASSTQSKRNRKGRLRRRSSSCASSQGPVRVVRIKPIAACTPRVANNPASSLENRASVLIRCARRMR